MKNSSQQSETCQSLDAADPACSVPWRSMLVDDALLGQLAIIRLVALVSQQSVQLLLMSVNFLPLALMEV